MQLIVANGHMRTSISLVALLAASAAHAQGLAQQLNPLIARHRGKVAVAVKHLGTGESFTHNADVPMPTASLIKFPIMIEAYRQAAEGKLDLDSTITVTKDDMVPGSGVLTSCFSPGAKFRLRDAVRLMIAFSDNTAANLVIDRIGLRSTAETMSGMGCPNTKLHSKVFRRDTSVFPERSKEFGLGSTTASEMVALLQKLYRRELVSKQASAAMIGHMLACRDTDKFRRFLPSGTKLAHKTGSVSAARCDAGILFTPGGAVAMCVLTSDNQDKRWVQDNAGNRLCANVAAAVYRYYAAKGGAKPRVTRLQMGASGVFVEDLQRTLNTRLTPSPELSVDGDFGPSTQAAVMRLQRDGGLDPTGVVDAATWKALGPLISTSKPVPPPEVVNSEKLASKPADPLTGRPFVSCKAWAIADSRTGNFLWGENENQKLDIASTTKIMTAYLVCELARKKPDVLDEIVTFSERADSTLGSTSGVRAGEKLSVRELLYGLLLPSGNDAAVAFAEHFGGRFASADGKPEPDPLPRFIAEMNRTAKRLGMTHTLFKNPHGLTAKGHGASARDMLVLAHAALSNPLFQRYVKTRQHGCRLASVGGHERDVAWHNTNRLLGIEGYVGVKTGTTRAAGACLVSSCRRGNDRLLMVVLGASGSAARYSDSRNLYRWAWLQRGAKH